MTRQVNYMIICFVQCLVKAKKNTAVQCLVKVKNKKTLQKPCTNNLAQRRIQKDRDQSK